MCFDSLTVGFWSPIKLTGKIYVNARLKTSLDLQFCTEAWQHCRRSHATVKVGRNQSDILLKHNQWGGQTMWLGALCSQSFSGQPAPLLHCPGREKDFPLSPVWTCLVSACACCLSSSHHDKAWRCLVSDLSACRQEKAALGCPKAFSSPGWSSLVPEGPFTREVLHLLSIPLGLCCVHSTLAAQCTMSWELLGSPNQRTWYLI